MKIKVTEIEATAEDLRQSTSLASAFTSALRRAFVGVSAPEYITEDTDDEETDGEEK
ncbi:MAG: hypothetical protein ABS879_08015 [Eubacteriales bacterium]